MILCTLLLDSGGLKFDWTVNVGNLGAAILFLLLAAIAWTDLRWRVRNLETGQKVHAVVIEKQANVIERIDKVLVRMEAFIGMTDQRRMGTIRTRKDDA